MSTRTIKNFLLLAALLLFFGAGEASAATNISAASTEHWAWNDVIGWMDFFNTNSVTVATNATTTGYASSSAGDISLDCATTRSGNICSTSSYGVKNDGVGNYSGWAWNDDHGWISFWCGNNDPSCAPNYRITIDTNGIFHGYAWNDVIGWISFNCSDPGVCGSSEYKVVTSWQPTSTIGSLESTTFDTSVSAGVQLNSVLWQGDLPAGTAVKFQFASSNSSSGPWGFSGTDGTSATYYDPTLSNTSVKLNYALYNNKRYFRYKAFLFSNVSSTLTPRVDDIVVNWSP